MSFSDAAKQENVNKCVKELHGYKFENGNELYVNKFENKRERQRKLKIEWNQNDTVTNKRMCFVKFISETVDEEVLRKEFEPYGTIESVKIQSEKVNKGDKV